MPARAEEKHSHQIDASVLGMPSGPWTFARLGPDGWLTYLIPAQLDAIRRLPEPERSSSLQAIGERQANLAFLRRTVDRFFRRMHGEGIHAVPEYAMDLGEVMMAIDNQDIDRENPLFLHEPVLQALPDYTKALLLAPADVLPAVKARLKALGLERKVRAVASQDAANHVPRDGVTRWVRDATLVAHDAAAPVLLTPLAHKDFGDLARNDLAYLSHLQDRRHHLARLPIFFRGGNLAVAEAGRKLLLVGSDEMRMNHDWFGKAFGFSPPLHAIQDILKAATGVDAVVILPNSRNLYHLDMFVAPLADGKIALLTPLDPEGLEPADREVLGRAGATLKQLGFEVVPIPTRAEWIRKFQSPVNIVNFVDRRTGHHRALVPAFPEAAGNDPSAGLNAKVLAAYRRAGIDPIPVEDRLHSEWGNTHCALVPLH